MWLLRSPENLKIVNQLRMQLDAKVEEYKGQGKEPRFLTPAVLQSINEAKPGDVLVDRDLRKVYYVDHNGSRRTVTDPDHKLECIEMARTLIAKIKEASQVKNDPPMVVVP